MATKFHFIAPNQAIDLPKWNESWNGFTLQRQHFALLFVANKKKYTVEIKSSVIHKNKKNRSTKYIVTNENKIIKKI